MDWYQLPANVELWIKVRDGLVDVSNVKYVLDVLHFLEVLLRKIEASTYTVSVNSFEILCG